ncbi:transcriptional repressor LexA [Cognatiluteimonas telluris]|jgi:repressor LexA|uniref:transcriptional repressor LexA n=1 Tax=Cognatiluteimonas telluris TaxID=1104775 RepID=UPI001407AED4|nr:transcriptional repressor LexA [Lysobacter telluris]
MPSPPDLTDRQQAILDFVRERIAADGLPPTWAEIARAFGFRQTRAAQKHLQALEAKGYLALLPGKARGIRLSPRLQRTPPREDEVELPILGRVAAGLPIGADAGVQRHLLLDRRLFSSPPDYLLRVQGDSMRGDGILDGDLVAVHRTQEARDGQTVIARLDDEITIKRLQVTPDGIRLLPRNPGYAPIEVAPGQDFAIEGIYCGLIREG